MARKSAKEITAVVSALGALLEIGIRLVAAIRAQGGDLPACIYRLATDDGLATLKKVADIMVADAQRVAVPVQAKHLIDCDAAPFILEGWNVKEHRKGGQLEWDLAKVTLLLVEGQKNDGCVEGHNLRELLNDQPVLNANVLDFLLLHPELIPEEWKGKTVFFWGTVYRNSASYLFVRCLCWRGDRCGWGCSWLDSAFIDDNPAAALLAS